MVEFKTHVCKSILLLSIMFDINQQELFLIFKFYDLGSYTSKTMIRQLPIQRWKEEGVGDVI